MYIDVHAHLDFYEDADSVIQQCKEKGVSAIITQGVNQESNEKTLKIAEKHPDIIKVALGIYPLDAPNVETEPEDGGRLHESKHSVDEMLAYIEEHKNKIIAIGEVGMDFKYSQDITNQKENMKKIIALARKIKKPLIVHSRKAELAMLDLLEEEKFFNVDMHCFMGKKSLIKRGAEMGLYFSVPAIINKLEHFKLLVEIVPLTQLLTETDAPWLSPYKDEQNIPANVAVAVEEIAKIKGITVDEAKKALFANYQRLFL